MPVLTHPASPLRPSFVGPAARPTPPSEFLGGDRLLRIDEAALYLRVSDKTVRRLIVDGKLQSGKLRGRRMIRLSDLNAMVLASMRN